MSLVLDTSLALSWFFADEQTSESKQVLDCVRQDGATVPSLWRLEIANALQASVRRKRVTHAFRDEALEQLERLSIAIDPFTDAFAWRKTLRLSDESGLTIYDAAYLELALRLAVPIATRDAALVRAAKQCEVEVFG